jgi:Retinoic acid induced 16-like protein
LSKGIASTDVPANLKVMVDLLVLESTRTEEGCVLFLSSTSSIYFSSRGTGACLEYLLKNGVSSSNSSMVLCSNYLDVLGTLVRLSEADRPSGIQAEVLRAVQNMVILLDEQFLVHSVVHRAVLRLLRNCVGDDIQEQLDNQNRKVMGAAKNVVRSSPSEYEEDREFPSTSQYCIPVSLT